MWWLVTLLIVAAIAFFAVKSMKAKTEQQQAEHDVVQQARLDASAAAQSAPAAPALAQATADGGTSTVAAAASVGLAATAAGAVSTAGISTDNTLSDVREMIKILNLDGPDAGRLQISREQMTALRTGEQAGLPDAATLDDVASRLRQMLA